MKNKMKKRCVKILTVLVCTIVLLGAFFVPASAQEVELEEPSSKCPIYRVDFLQSTYSGANFYNEYPTIWEGFNWGIHFTWTPTHRICDYDGGDGDEHPEFYDYDNSLIDQEMTMDLISKKAMPLASWVGSDKTLVIEFGKCDPVKTYSDPDFEVVFNETFWAHGGPAGLYEYLTSDNYYECRLIISVLSDGTLQCKVIYRCIEKLSDEWHRHLTTYTGYVDMTKDFYLTYAKNYIASVNRDPCNYLVKKGFIKESSPYMEYVSDAYYDAGIEDGYDDAWADGNNYGYNNGFIDGKKDGYELGYDDGVSESYDLGFDDGWADGNNHGVTDTLNSTSTFKDMVFAIFDAPVSLVNNMLDFDLLGINVLSLSKTVLTVAVIAVIVTVLIKFIL